MTHSSAKKLLALVAILLSALFTLVSSDDPAPRTFQEAKKIARELYTDEGRTFYCGCRYQGNRVDLESCGYVPRKNAQRAARIEWEHVVPAWVIGHQRQCWKNGGRKQLHPQRSSVRPRRGRPAQPGAERSARSTATAATSR